MGALFGMRPPWRNLLLLWGLSLPPSSPSLLAEGAPSSHHRHHTRPPNRGDFFFVDFDDGRYVPMLGNIGRWDWYQTLPQYSEVASHIEEVAPHTDVPRKRISRPLRQWFGKRDGSEAGVYPKRMLGRMGKRSSKVLGRITKRSSNLLGRITKRQEEEVARMLVRITKRQDEEVARILGRMTKRGKLSKMRGEDDVEEPWLQVVRPGGQWFDMDITDQWPNGWGRASKRATDDGRRFSRVGVWDREDITGKEKMVLRKRSGPGGRFIRIGMAEEDVDKSKEMRLVNKRSAENDQSSRWIRIG